MAPKGVEPHPAAAPAAAVAVLASAGHLDERETGDRTKERARRLVLAVVAREVARVVVGDGPVHARHHERPQRGEALDEELRVVEHLPGAAQLRVLVPE